MFSDLRRSHDSGIKGTTPPGALWFLEKVSDSLLDNQACSIKIITAVNSNQRDLLLEDEIKSIATTRLAPFINKGLRIEVHVLPRYVPDEIRRKIHGRRILFGPHSLVTLDRGLSDFSIETSHNHNYSLRRQKEFAEDVERSSDVEFEIHYLRFGGESAKTKIIDPLLERVRDTGVVFAL